MSRLDLISDLASRFKAFVLRWRNVALISLVVLFLALGIVNALFGAMLPRAILASFQVISLGLALNIVVPLLIDMHQRVADRYAPKDYPNLREAFADILNQVGAQSKARATTPQQVQIVGMRLGTLADLLSAIAEKRRSPGADKRPLEITVYHVDPRYLETVHLKYEGREQDRNAIRDDFTHQARDLSARIVRLTNLYRDLPNTELKFQNYEYVPQIWSILVGDGPLFWGYITWDALTHNWIGSNNKCYVGKADELAEGGQLGGLLNRVETLNHWSEETDPETLTQFAEDESRRPAPSIAARHYDALAPWMMTAEAKWYSDRDHHDLIIKQVPRSVDRVLDLGCGPGLFARSLRRKRGDLTLLLSDLSPRMIAAARSVFHDRNCELRCGDWVDTLSDNEGALSCVIVKNTIHALTDLPTKVSNLRRWVAADGKVIISETIFEENAHDFLGQMFRKTNPTVYRNKPTFDEASIVRVFSEAGWSVVPDSICHHPQWIDGNEWLKAKASGAAEFKDTLDFLYDNADQYPNLIRRSAQDNRPGIELLRNQLICSFTHAAD